MVFCYLLLVVSIQLVESIDPSNTTLIPPSANSLPVPTPSVTQSVPPVIVTTSPTIETAVPVLLTTEATTVPPDLTRGCGADELKFTYTPCDEDDNRWRVQVPSKPVCRLKYPVEPKQGIKCTYSCKPGQFLDITTQKCQKCPAGQYSVGDGKRYSNWDKLPEGFVTKGFDSSKTTQDKEIRRSVSDENDVCKDAKWRAKGHYLESNGSSCRSVFSLKVDLIRNGNITFTVKSGDESSLFHVWVENQESCNHQYDEEEGPEDSPKSDQYFTVTADWKSHTMELKKGKNTILFLAAHFSSSFEDSGGNGGSFDSDSEKTVMIKEIVVRGFASSYNCDSCPAGTFSTSGSSQCSPCPADTYSTVRADMCIKCGMEEYSAERAYKCQKREPCSEKDYFMFWEPCKNGKTRKNFQWKEPQICSPRQDSAVTLPEATTEIDCPSCNPGQYMNGTHCDYCPKDFYGSGKGACTKCPPTTRGAPGLFYRFWTRFPSAPMHLYCIAKPKDGCSTKKGWMVNDEYISTGNGHSDDAEQLMVITIPEFTKEKNEFKLEFSVHCPSEKCRFKIELMDSDSSLHVIRTYEGHTPRTTYTHVRHSSNPARYRLVFEKKYRANQQTYQYTDSRLKIYSLSITNVKKGGTEKCEKCSTDGEDCIKCPTGNYVEGGQCIPCPKNTYFNSDSPLGAASCKPCPVGTVSAPASTFCHSNCLIKGTGNRTYNFAPLSGLHMTDGQKRFTTKGYLYYHQFKLTFCGVNVKESECANNATNKKGFAAKAAICRSTIIPDNNMVVSAQSISIGKVLEEIKTVSVEAKKDNTSSIKRSASDEIVFKFHSFRTTEVCKNGTYGIVRLVCDPRQSGKGKVELGDGKSCKSETCDGCTYTFTVKSQHACAECQTSDYEVINTACANGVKRTHYVWRLPHVCVDSGIKPIDTESECTIFEKSILDFKVIILAFLVGGLVLAIIVLYLCYRNRRLSYNYHKLIDASQMRDGELPASEMCALEDGEEEEEEIIISKGKAGAKIMDRLRGIRKNKKDFSEFETINLDTMQYSDDDEI